MGKERFTRKIKPVALFQYLQLTYTNEGDTILDNVAGSFTTAIAADNIKRNWICIEKEAEYCEIGKKRIEENRERLRNIDR
jgi:site-specific DNA-methyltransferase (adenine-specific)